MHCLTQNISKATYCWVCRETTHVYFFPWHVGLYTAASLFCTCLVSVHARLCTICTCLFRQMERLFLEIFRFWRICRSDCHDDSLYLFVLVLFPDSVVPSIRTAFNIFYQHIVHVDWGVVYNHHICLLLSSDTSCSICCNYCSVPLHRICQQQSGEC